MKTAVSTMASYFLQDNEPEDLILAVFMVTLHNKLYLSNWKLNICVSLTVLFVVWRLVYLLTYLLTYLLAPYSRVLFEKLTSSQLLKKFPAFYGTRRFITAFASARHLSLS
jgi:hypothetical protein